MGICGGAQPIISSDTANKNTNERLSGRTGKLFIDATRRIHRELTPAIFIKGIATTLTTEAMESELHEGNSG